MATFVSKRDPTMEEKREKERIRLREEIARKKELSEFNQISKVVQYAAFVAPCLAKKNNKAKV